MIFCAATLTLRSERSPLILCDDLALEAFCFLSGALLSGDSRDCQLVGHSHVSICQKLLNRCLMVSFEDLE